MTWPLMRFILQGWLVTIWLCLLVMGAALAISLLLGVLRASGRWYLSGPVTVYVYVVRGVPVIVLLLILFFGLPARGIPMSSFAAAFIGLLAYSTSYVTEIVGGAIKAIPRVQWDAARTLGLSYPQVMTRVIIPQAARLMIPPTLGFFLALTKASAIVFIVGYRELMRSATIVMERLQSPFLVFGIVSVLYFTLCFPLSRAAKWLERRYAVIR